MAERDDDEIGALWQRESKKGTVYLSGKIDWVDVVAFRNNKKTDKQPDWKVLRSRPRDDRPQREEQDDRRAQAEEARARADIAAMRDDDIPF